MRRLALFAALTALLLAGLAGSAAVLLDRRYPIVTRRLAESSTVVADCRGMPLRIFTTPSGLWRLPVDPDRVSPTYLRLLVDIEDKRFAAHPGVDPLALARAVLQRLERGHVVSGASTLTMQVVRLLEPRPRTLRSKLIEIARALQLEAHWSKRQILAAYLTLTPMGRNIEGVRAGSLVWFGKEPGPSVRRRSGVLLVALPRKPPPDFGPTASGPMAEAARARVLRRAEADGVLPAAAPGQRPRGADAGLPVIRCRCWRLISASSWRAANPRAPTSSRRSTGPLQEGAERVLAPGAARTAAPHDAGRTRGRLAQRRRPGPDRQRRLPRCPPGGRGRHDAGGPLPGARP